MSVCLDSNYGLAGTNRIPCNKRERYEMSWNVGEQIKRDRI